jgi:GMP synthase (glutamine-hydrolysing)
MGNQEDSENAGKLRAQETTARLLNVPSRNVHVRIFKDKATGVESGRRRYGEVIGITIQTMNGKPHHTSLQNIIALQARIITENPEAARIFYAIRDSEKQKKYIMGIRSVETKNFLEAKVTEAPWSTLEKIADEITEKCPDVSTVYYDVTPKPPATIEME